MADPLPEFVFDLINGPVLTLVSGSISASLYLTSTGRVGMGEPSAASPSVDTAILSHTASYVPAGSIDVWKSAQDGTTSGGILFTEHFLSPTTALISGLASTVSGPSAAVSLIVGKVGHPGIAQISTGTNANGRSSLVTHASCIIFGSGSYTLETEILIPTGSSANQRFTASFGFGSNTAAGDMVDGAYFQYADASSANWLIKTANNSVRTTVTTTVPVTTNTWYKLRVSVVNSATASFYINDVEVGKITTNIPSAVGRETGFITKIEKNNGTTASVAWVDYIKVTYT